MNRPRCLLDRLQGLLERTYSMSPGLGDLAPFVIGDQGYRCLYAGANGDAHRDDPARTAGAARTAGIGARTLVRDTEEGVRLCIYYPDRLVRHLEAYPPERGLGDDNVDAFATLVEELDHLLVLAERAGHCRPSTLFDLELHANVSKYLVLSRFLSQGRGRLGPRRRTWLRYHLFHKGSWAGSTEAERARYRDAARWALRFLDAAERPGRAGAAPHRLRMFHVADAPGKLELIERMARDAA